jgi:hypothetical protein
MVMLQGESPLRRRPKGFPIALWKPSVRTLLFIGFDRKFLVKALPHNSSAALAMPFLPSAACKFLDLPPVNLRNLHLHLTKNAFAIAPTHLCGIALVCLSFPQ